MKTIQRICLVTWTGSPNFGTNLQAYAMQLTLIKMGCRVCILSELPHDFGFFYTAYSFVCKTRFYPLWLRIKQWLCCKDRIIIANSKIRRWEKKHLNTISIHFPLELHHLVRDTDCFIAGSDQIWNSYIGFDPTMFLSFAKNKKRIAYASSIGTSGINPVHMEEIRDLLCKFQHIGVREESAVGVLKALTGRNDIVSVLDPTFLLSPIDWTAFAEDATIQIDDHRPYIMCYLLGKNSNYSRYVADVQMKTGLDNVFIVPACENPDFDVAGAHRLTHLSPPDFIHLLSKAAVICTDSFHATALSINLSKDFIEFLRFQSDDPNSQNCRIMDLLAHYQLSGRIYNTSSNEWLKQIDYSKVQSILQIDKFLSNDFLKKSIED